MLMGNGAGCSHVRGKDNTWELGYFCAGGSEKNNTWKVTLFCAGEPVHIKSIYFPCHNIYGIYAYILYIFLRRSYLCIRT